MATEGLTRKAIRQAVGRSLMGYEFIVSAASANGNAGGTTLVDDTLSEASASADDRFNGWWVVITSGTHIGQRRIVSDYDGASTTITLRTAVTAASQIDSGDTYELWKPIYVPDQVDDFINQAINEVMGRFYKREESLALHADGRTARFSLPAEFDMVDRVEHRVAVESVTVHKCDSTFDDNADADLSTSVDTEDHRTGSSLKIDVEGTQDANDFVSTTIGTVDLSGYTHIEGWVKATEAAAAGDYVVHLDNGPVQGTNADLERLDVPAFSADTWTYFRVALGRPEDDTAIVSVGFLISVVKGAHVVWFDDIRATNDDSAQWAPLGKHLWGVDREAGDLVLKPAGVGVLGYSPLKLSGGSLPAQMTSDSDVATVNEEYLIAKATSLMLMAGSRAGDADTDGRRSLGGYWEGRANRAKGKFPPLTSARKVS